MHQLHFFLFSIFKIRYDQHNIYIHKYNLSRIFFAEEMFTNAIKIRKP